MVDLVDKLVTVVAMQSWAYKVSSNVDIPLCIVNFWQWNPALRIVWGVVRGESCSLKKPAQAKEPGGQSCEVQRQ